MQNANVNLASERASLEYDPAQLTQEEIVHAHSKGRYNVAMGEAVVPLKRLSDMGDAQRLEEKVLSQQEGVVEAHVNLATEKAVVRYVPDGKPGSAAPRRQCGRL